MEFRTNTQPLADALNLGIVNANVTTMYGPSCTALVTATERQLTINLEQSLLVSEIRVPGKGSEDTEVSIFVSSMMLKQLVNSFETTTLDVIFENDGLTLKSGSSKFTLPKILDAEVEFRRPQLPDYGQGGIDLEKDNWKFIQSHQMYAVAMNFVHPVYTHLWVGKEGDTIGGDFDNSLFTYSKKSTLQDQCLLSSTIVNLLTSIPEDSKIYKIGDSYSINVQTDGYQFISEFTPNRENEGDYGDYNAPLIMSVMETDEDHCIRFNPNPINKFLSQVDIVSEESNSDKVTLSYTGGTMSLSNKNASCNVDITSSLEREFTCDFNLKTLKSVMSTYDNDEIAMIPVFVDDSTEASGVTIWSDELVTSISGVE